MNARFARSLLLLPAAVAIASSSYAAQDQTTVQVTANVVSSCNFQGTSTAIAFGAISAFTAAAVPATGKVTLQCNKNATVSVDISTGGNYGAGPLRNMKNGSDLIPYHIYQPTGLTAASAGTCGTTGTEWGTGVTGGATLSVSSIYSASGGPRDINLCGVVDPAPAGGYAVGTTYTDTVTVTATF